MATITKLYLSGLSAPYTPATLRGAWDQTAQQITRALVPTKQFPATNDVSCRSFVSAAETDANTAWDVLLYRGVSAPLAAHTFGGTVNVVYGSRESNADADMVLHVHIYVTQGDSDTPRGTLLTDYINGIEFSTSFLVQQLDSPQALAALGVSAGDRIVVELGYRAGNSTTSSRTGDLFYGTESATPTADAADATVGGNPFTSDQVCYLEFSDPIPLADSTMRVTHVKGEVLDDVDDQTLRVTHVKGEVLDQGPLPDLALRVTYVRGEIWESLTEEPVPPEEPPEPEPNPNDAIPVGRRLVVQICEGGSWRTFWRRYGVVRYLGLGDVGTTVARDEADDPLPVGLETLHASTAIDGVYSGEPAKGLGLLPEYALATRFDGVDDFVQYETSGVGDGAFAVAAMVRPDRNGGGAGTSRCVVSTGPGAAWLGISDSDAFAFGVNGGAKITSSFLVTSGANYCVIGDYDGTHARLYVGRQGAAMQLVAGPTPLSITGHGTGRIGANNSEEFTGEIQGVVLVAGTLASGTIQEAWRAATWVDVTEDVLDRVALVVDRGIHGDRTDQRVAATGKLTVAFNNSQFNSAATLGYYSPGHANARTGFDRGTMIRVAIADSADDTFVAWFVGRIKSIRPTPGVWEDRGVSVVAHDWMHEASKFTLKEIETQVDLRPDEAIEIIVDRMRNRPHGLALAESADTYPVVFDGSGEKRKASEELVRLMNSERGWLYLRGDGTLVMQSRSSRVGDGDAAYSFENVSMHDLDVERSTDQRVNRVKATVHPRRVDVSEVVLYSADKPVAVDNGVTTTTLLKYRDPNQEASKVGGIDVVDPVASTDYTLNTAEDGSGIDVTSDPSITVTGVKGSDGYYLTVTNAYGLRVYFTLLQVRGRGIYDYNPVTLVAEDVTSIDEDGLEELDIDLPYQEDATIGQDVAQFELVSSAAMPTRVKTLSFKLEDNEATLAAGLGADISTRVSLSETLTGVSGEYLINGIRLSWGVARDIVVTWWLVPADTSSPWIFDVSTFDETTTFGFG